MDEGSSGDGYIYRYTRMTVTTTVQYVCDTFMMTMMTHTSLLSVYNLTLHSDPTMHSLQVLVTPSYAYVYHFPRITALIQ